MALEESKAFLLKADAHGHNLFDHLKDLILTIVEQRPDNALDAFEEISSKVKRATHQPDGEPDQEVEGGDPIDSAKLQQRMQLFNRAKKGAAEDEEEDAGAAHGDGDVQNLVEDACLFEWAGVSLGREESYRLSLAMIELAHAQPLASVRLFGKVLGTRSDYVIFETEYRQGEVPADEGDADGDESVSAAADEAQQQQQRQQQQQQQQQNRASKATTGRADGDESSDDEEHRKAELPPPRSDPSPTIPPDEFGQGTNRYTYWVCSGAGEPCVRLPSASPKLIQAARSITKFFTGDLEAEVNSWPLFPGREKHLLRAQIARIAHSSIVSPRGYYIYDDEESEQEDRDEDAALIPDPEYQELPAAQLLNPSNWVHHLPFVLPQGRTTFWKTSKSKKGGDGEDEDDEDDDEDEDDAPGSKSELGPKPLTEIAADDPVGGFDAWSLRLSSPPGLKHSFVYARSNRWPGAHAVAHANRFANIYVGFGTPNKGVPHTPAPPRAFQVEQDDLNFVEAWDPTVEEEEEHEKKMKAIAGGSGEGEDGEDGEKDSDDDDDGSDEDD